MSLSLKKSVNIGEHFHAHAQKYQDVVRGTNKQLYDNIRKQLDRHLFGTVLDIGNGNVFNYQVEKLEQIIAVDLAFKNMADTQNIKFFSGDARNLSMVKTKSCDCVVMQFLIHHIVDRTKTLTDVSVMSVLLECRRVLKENGKLIIVEMLVPHFIETMENLLYRFNHALLSCFDKPMIRFYSKQGLFSRLNKAGFHQVTHFEIDVGKWIDPFEGLFPGRVKLPRFLYPAQCQFMISS